MDAATRTVTLLPSHAMPSTAFDAENVRVVPAVIFEIPLGTSNLARNGILMSDAIEDLQVEFWASGTPVDDPVDDLGSPINGIDASTIQRVRITVVSAATQNDTGSTKKFGGGARPAIANRAAGAADSIQRRVFSGNVRPRNISVLP